MRLKPQNSAKQVLEAEIDESRQVRGSLTEEINALVKQRNEALRQVEAEGERLMASLRETERVCASRKAELLGEIASLEARRSAAMQPLDERRRQLDERAKELDSAYAILAESAQKNDEMRVLLSEKMAQASDMLSEAAEKNVMADYRLVRVAESEEMHRKALSAMNERSQAFLARVAEWEKGMVSQETELSIRENAIASEKKWLVEERDRNVAEKRANQSERAAVDAAFAEGRKKKYL